MIFFLHETDDKKTTSKMIEDNGMKWHEIEMKTIISTIKKSVVAGSFVEIVTFLLFGSVSVLTVHDEEDKNDGWTKLDLFRRTDQKKIRILKGLWHWPMKWIFIEIPYFLVFFSHFFHYSYTVQIENDMALLRSRYGQKKNGFMQLNVCMVIYFSKESYFL